MKVGNQRWVPTSWVPPKPSRNLVKRDLILSTVYRESEYVNVPLRKPATPTFNQSARAPAQPLFLVTHASSETEQEIGLLFTLASFFNFRFWHLPAALNASQPVRLLG